MEKIKVFAGLAAISGVLFGIISGIIWGLPAGMATMIVVFALSSAILRIFCSSKR